MVLGKIELTDTTGYVRAQFEHFGDDAPACDICGSITVRNGTCYKCFNYGWDTFVLTF